MKKESLTEKIVLEEWADLPGYEGKYQISNFGRVKTLDSVFTTWNGVKLRKEKILKPQRNQANKAYTVMLCDKDRSSKKKKFLIYTLVQRVTFTEPTKLEYIPRSTTKKKDLRVRTKPFMDEKWQKPRMGTDRQHKYLCNEAVIFRYTSAQEFLNAWPAYRDKKIQIEPDGSINKLQAHLFLHYLRRVKYNLRKKLL